MTIKRALVRDGRLEIDGQTSKALRHPLGKDDFSNS
jgi:hypothetical protein